MRLPTMLRHADGKHEPKSARQQEKRTKNTDAKKEKKCGFCRFRCIVFPWREPPGRICIPPTIDQPDGLRGCSIDREEWEVVQRNFPDKVGQYYTPDDPDKPDAFMYTATTNGTNYRLAPVPPYQHRNDESSLPSYEWARLSSLPTPVVIDDSWSSLLAAQREKSRLLETQSYIASRIAEIDRKIRTVMDAKQKQDPVVHQRYCSAQMTGALHAAGLPDNRWRIRMAREVGQLPDPSESEWLYDLGKLFVMRERLSPLSLLSPPPAY